jgi:enoyl-CoA hydratase/carnithine racemase
MTDVTTEPAAAGSADPGLVVTWTARERAFLVQLANPPANQLSPPLVAGLAAAVGEFEASDARVLIIHSVLDGFFMAGGDIKFMSGADPATIAAYLTALRDAFDRIAALDRPSIAVIEGRALGGGLELALACTMRIGSSAARLGVPETKLGLIPGAGGTQRLPRLVGRGRALDMMLTARQVNADEALAIGLLDRVTEPGGALALAVQLAGQFGAMSRPALAAVLRCVDDSADLPLADGLAREADRVTGLFDSPDGREGLAAFVAKRPANFA